MDTVTLTVDKQQDQLPLDEQCFSALHSITAHLNDNDFVERNRPILQLIGFRNSFIEKKDSKRNLQSDVNGHPLLKNMRNDFSTAVRCLRNTTGFIEGSSLTDTCAHFVLIKNREHVGGAGHNKQTLWVRKNALERWTRVCKISGRTAKKIENGTVYFIHMENNLKMFKIGYSTNLKKRVESLQIGNPYLLCVYTTIDNVSRKKETQLHHFFSKKHIRGEWFAITPDMIDFVCNHMS